MFTLEIEIPHLPRMSNGLLRQHYWKIKSEKDKWHKLIICEIGLNRPDVPLKKAKIDFTRFSAKKPDKDGLISGFKYVQDALVLGGIIEDDSDDVIDTSHAWEFAGRRKGKIRIVVQEIVDSVPAAV